MNDPIGRRRWVIAEGYIPGWSNGPEPQFTSHETACLLNASDEQAHVEIKLDGPSPDLKTVAAVAGGVVAAGALVWRLARKRT